MTDLFPLPPARFGNLNNDTQQVILQQLNLLKLHQDTLLRPAQATLPMGFTWEVSLAHDATPNIIKEAFNQATAAKALINSKHTLNFFRRTDAPFHLVAGLALALPIIDDISIIFFDWGANEITTVHKLLNTLLVNAGLPIAIDKSFQVGKVEEGSIPFIGHDISLTERKITPMAARVSKLKTFIDHLDLSTIISFTLWASLRGKLVSFAMLHRAKLSQFNRVYRESPKPPPANRTNPTKHNLLVSKTKLQEIIGILSLIPLAQVNYNLPFSTTLVAFDASLIAAAIMYTEVSLSEAIQIWDKDIIRKATKDPTPVSDPWLEELASKLKWKVAVHHVWTPDEDGKVPHINVFEARASNMAVDWVQKRHKH